MSSRAGVVVRGRTRGAWFALGVALVGCEPAVDGGRAGTDAGLEPLADGAAPLLDAGADVDGSGPIAPDAGLTVDAGGGPVVDEARLAGLTGEIAAAVCGALVRCCDGESQSTYFGSIREAARLEAFRDRLPPSATLDLASCTDVLTEVFDVKPFGSWVEAARAGRVTFVGDEFDACLGELEAAECGPSMARALFDSTCFGFAPPAGGTSQRRMFRRSAGEGASCAAIDDGFGGGLYGSCDPDAAFCCYPREGGGCGLPTDTVRSGTCAPVAALAAPCAYASLPLTLCASGQFCDDAGRCAVEATAPLAAGASCATPSFDVLGVCPAGTYCDFLGDRTCAAQRRDGDACVGGEECLGGRCAAGVCATDRTCAGLAPAPSPGVSTLAGSGMAGSADGRGASASFTAPFGIAWHPGGFLLVTEDANRLRRVDLDGTVSSVVIGGAAIDAPRGLAIAADGTVYVAQGNHVVLAVTGLGGAIGATSGTATVLAGSPGIAGDLDGVGGGSRFRTPRGLALDADGSLLVTEATGHRLRRIVTSGAMRGAVTTVAGNGTTGFADGPVASATLYFPWGVAVAADGVFLVGQDVCVRRIEGGVVGRVAGLCQNFGNTGNADGAALDARFQGWPRALAVEPSGALLVADSAGNLLRRVSADRLTVSTVAGRRTGTSGAFGGDDGALLDASFATPTGLARGPEGAWYVAENGGHRIRRVVLSD